MTHGPGRGPRPHDGHPRCTPCLEMGGPPVATRRPYPPPEGGSDPERSTFCVPPPDSSLEPPSDIRPVPLVGDALGSTEPGRPYHSSSQGRVSVILDMVTFQRLGPLQPVEGTPGTHTLPSLRRSYLIRPEVTDAARVLPSPDRPPVTDLRVRPTGELTGDPRPLGRSGTTRTRSPVHHHPTLRVSGTKRVRVFPPGSPDDNMGKTVPTEYLPGT